MRKVIPKFVESLKAWHSSGAAPSKWVYRPSACGRDTPLAETATARGLRMRRENIPGKKSTQGYMSTDT